MTAEVRKLVVPARAVSADWGVVPLMKVVGLLVAAVCLVFGPGSAVRAQTLQNGAVSLWAGNSATLSGYTIQIASCSVDNGGSFSADCPQTGGDLYLYPYLSRGALNVIIEAATGGTPGSSLEQIFTCIAGSTCTTGTYDLSVELDVSGPASVTAVAQTLTGVVSPSASGAVYNTENILGENDPLNPVALCTGLGTTLTASGPTSTSATCSFSGTPQNVAVDHEGPRAEPQQRCERHRVVAGLDRTSPDTGARAGVTRDIVGRDYRSRGRAPASAPRLTDTSGAMRR